MTVEALSPYTNLFPLVIGLYLSFHCQLYWCVQCVLVCQEECEGQHGLV